MFKIFRINKENEVKIKALETYLRRSEKENSNLMGQRDSLNEEIMVLRAKIKEEQEWYKKAIKKVKK